MQNPIDVFCSAGSDVNKVNRISNQATHLRKLRERVDRDEPVLFNKTNYKSAMCIVFCSSRNK